MIGADAENGSDGCDRPYVRSADNPVPKVAPFPRSVSGKASDPCPIFFKTHLDFFRINREAEAPHLEGGLLCDPVHQFRISSACPQASETFAVRKHERRRRFNVGEAVMIFNVNADASTRDG